MISHKSFTTIEGNLLWQFHHRKYIKENVNSAIRYFLQITPSGL